MDRAPAVWLGLALPLVLAAGACASSGDPFSGERAGEPDAVTVEVRNEHWSDMRVYALAGSARHRLGTVASMSTVRLDLTEPVLPPDGSLRFILDPIGGGRQHVTAVLMIWSGGRVDITVRNQIGLTVASVR